jgi:hypothetical protein
MSDTGFPRADAENDFLRARRHQFLAALAHRLSGGHGAYVTRVLTAVPQRPRRLAGSAR